MILSDCLTPSHVVLPLEAASLEDAVRALLERVSDALPDAADLDKLARDVAFGSRGEVVRLNERVVAVLVLQDGLTGTEALVGVAPKPFTVTGEGREEPESARALFVFVCPRRLSAFRGQAIPALGRWVRETGHTEALLEASSPGALLSLPGLGQLNLAERVRVESAMTPVTYRIYPDTPLQEVLEFMIRRGVHALPVVGEGYEVLGIITAGEILGTLLPRRRGREGDAADVTAETEGLTARDVMTRTVLCVSEDQSLVDAASVMVNRDVEQLPVVREGELVGFLTRDAVLRTLYGQQ
jgi:CBS domain-containing protein